MKKPRLFLRLPLFLLVLHCGKEKADPPASAQTPPAAGSGLEVKDRLASGREFPRLIVADHVGNRYEFSRLLSKPKNIVLLLDAACPACAEESKMIQKFALLRPELNVLGISKDTLPAVLAFKKRHGLIFPILLDVEGKLVPDYRRVSFPTLVLVGPDKKIVKLYEGEIPPAQAGPLLRMLLGP
ncbi:MAG: TlpA family protein disulfide reductase [candidate division Zixibacteria bacterium]|nr:TlpA family protein disulfide reductase [candidate division Zixibacteria bacterium]MCI0595984.1 TlpA family protein disulfide reductase [candidate division Zixibacteria bacterium]